MKYCSNCDNEATQEAVHDDVRTPLCTTCATAYKWGQASPEAVVRRLYDWLADWQDYGDDMSCPECDASGQIKTQDGITLCYSCAWSVKNPVIR